MKERKVDFTTTKAGFAVLMWEKKNGSILQLYEPSITSVVELIKLGSGVDSDLDGVSVLVDLMAEGSTLRDVCFDLIRKSSRYSIAGADGAEKIISEISRRVSQGFTDLVDDSEDAPVSPADAEL